MTEAWNVIIEEILKGCLSNVLNLCKIIIPLMILVEFLMAYKLVEKLSNKLAWFAKLLGISKNALLPLLVAMIMGVAYGAGTLMEINKKTPLSKRDLGLLAIFIYCCHALMETTLLFAIVGANIWVVSLLRLGVAIILTMLAARLNFVRKVLE